jgi:hypothetical protein
MRSYSEDHLVEQPAIQLIQHELGWDVVNCYDEWSGGVSNQGRDGKREVVLVSRLRPALQRLNPNLPVEAIEGAVAVMPGARRSGNGLRRDGFVCNYAGPRTPQPLSAERLLQFASCGIPISRVIGIHEDDN